MSRKHLLRSERLLETVAECPRLAIVTHDNPDPDAISSGWAIATLLRERAGRRPRFVAGGEVLRAENRHMMELLDPPLELVDRLEPADKLAVILVDCGVNGSNHLLFGSNANIVAVIDHHQQTGKCPTRFKDIRPGVAACASIATQYLREQNIFPSTRLATALMYGIHTETAGFETSHSQTDRRALRWLTAYANPDWLAEIQNAPLPREYFSDLVLALQNTFLYDGAAFCVLPKVSGPEVVGEVADLVIRCKDVCFALCAGVWESNALVSIRTKPGTRSAAQLADATLRGLGYSGGHQHRAGGKIVDLRTDRISESLEDELRQRWLDACHVDRMRGTRLIAPRDIRQVL